MKSFTELRTSLRENALMLGSTAQGIVKNMRQLRACAYRMAVEFTLIRSHHIEYLRVEIRDRYPDGEGSIDQWISDEFGPFIALGGNPYELFKLVEAGVTLKKFLSDPLPLPFNRKARASPASLTLAAATADIPPEPPADHPPRQAEVCWKQRALALEQQVNSLRPLLGEVELLRKKVRQLQAIVNRIPLPSLA